MNYVIFRFVEGVKMYLGNDDWELSKADAVSFDLTQAIALYSCFDDCDYEVA